ncbi:MAG: helix-turn-helix domain-containing protein [Halobacteria archaeon]|nr:helix-turn-helix domain-containing protein [Halobacteria archaeon]
MSLKTQAEETEGSIRTEIAVRTPGGCPVAEASKQTEGQVHEVNRSVTSSEDGTVREEFTVEGGEGESGHLPDPEMDRVFDFASHSVYRFSRDRAESCVCDTIELFDCPVSEIKAEDGVLYITFYAPDIEKIKEIIDDLNHRFAGVYLRELTQPDDGNVENMIFVNRNRLTERQHEVLRTAHEMGYFEHPKESNASDVAEELDIALSTFTEHLAAAQKKILDSVLEL